MLFPWRQRSAASSLNYTKHATLIYCMLQFSVTFGALMEVTEVGWLVGRQAGVCVVDYFHSLERKKRLLSEFIIALQYIALCGFPFMP